ncbi:MAG: hypothetical protein M3032_04585 [Verrucomicrobiota bacterium]|nr:hypothetical protein [Verrucomicrobiota bacterium]
MRIRVVLLLIFMSVAGFAAEVALPAAQEAFRKEIGPKVAALEKKNATAFAGTDGWLFLTAELRFLAQGKFWGDAAAKVSRSHKPENADPIPAIADFDRQLKARGIKLLVVPIPAKAAIYPDKLGIAGAIAATDTAPYLQEFYGELGRRGIDYLDLTGPFAAKRDDKLHGPLYCRTDTHWSGHGVYIAAVEMAREIRPVIAAEAPRTAFLPEWKEVMITGDLPPLAGVKAEPEKIAIRQMANAVQPDPTSPVLLMGDSHTLVFHEFLAERAGLLEQLGAELGRAPDLIGTRGSGATAVRVSMYRRAKAEPNFLAGKKVVLWCFAARELTEADQGWVVQPIAK